MQTKHSFKYWQWRVIISTMIGYSMFYFVRKNFSFAMPMLGKEYGITNTSFGVILSLVGIIYGISKFINGFIADRTNARWHMSLGLAVCVVVNVLFGFSDKFAAWITGGTEGGAFVAAMVNIFAVLLIVNNIFQGTGFSPCNRLMTHWVPPEELATKMSIWNTSHSIGAGLASVMCGYIISKTGDWRLCFWIPAAISFIGVIFIIGSLRDTPKSVGLPELPNTKTSLDGNDTNKEYRKFVKEKVLKNPVVWLLAITDLFVYIVRFSVLDWGPTFLQEQRLSPELAGWTVGIFEVSGCVGMLVAGRISDTFFKGRSQRTCAVEMILTAICLLALWLLPDGSSPVLMLILLSLAGFFLYGPQALLGVVASNQVTNRAASSAVGLIGLCSYASVIFTGAGLGWFTDKFGWGDVFLLMSIVAVIGSFFIFPLWNLSKDGYIHDNDAM
ncbi:MAG: MFS transporter [Bacteroidales bacterium]|nr:MFS transporter [Bacteroidales bacterium]